MAKQRNNETIYRCVMCGEPLSEDNCRQVQSEFSQSGFSPYCVECESRIYNHFARSQGKYHALLTACGAFNVPCKPLLLDGVNLDEEPDAWLLYVNLLSESGQDTKGGKVLGFADGVTTLWGLFGNKLGEPNFEKRIALEKEKIKKQIGTPEQLERWGVGKEYQTQADYDELDRLFEARLASYQGQDLTPQAICILENVAKWTFKIDKLIEKGNFNGAKALNDMIDKNLASENLRLKDGKQTENLRMDLLVDALERKGLMEQGKFKTKDEVIEAIAQNFTGTKKYDYPIDALHQMELNILNTMRSNADFGALFDLPKDMEVKDTNGEFVEEESEEYKKRKRYANLTEIQFIDGNEKQQKTQPTKPKTRAKKNDKL